MTSAAAGGVLARLLEGLGEPLGASGIRFRPVGDPALGDLSVPVALVPGARTDLPPGLTECSVRSGVRLLRCADPVLAAATAKVLRRSATWDVLDLGRPASRPEQAVARLWSGLAAARSGHVPDAAAVGPELVAAAVVALVRADAGAAHSVLMHALEPHTPVEPLAQLVHVWCDRRPELRPAGTGVVTAQHVAATGLVRVAVTVLGERIRTAGGIVPRHA